MQASPQEQFELYQFMRREDRRWAIEVASQSGVANEKLIERVELILDYLYPESLLSIGDIEKLAG